MDPAAQIPLSNQSLIQFQRLKTAKQMVEWNQKHTPWIFQLDQNMEQLLYQQYQDQIDGQLTPREYDDSNKENEQLQQQQKD